MFSLFCLMGIHRKPEFLLLASLIFCLWCDSHAFQPVDNYLIDCGSGSNTSVNGRVFSSDDFLSKIITTPQKILAATASNSISSGEDSTLYQTARILTGPSSFKFSIGKQGRHWIRLYFFPFIYQTYNLKTFKFSVSTNQFVLLSDFQIENDTIVFKEYSVNITSDTLDLKFTPSGNSLAFVNAIEVVSVPDGLITDQAKTVNPSGDYQGLLNDALETVHRVNMGGPLVSPSNDSLSRTWLPDLQFLRTKALAKPVVYGGTINYFKGGATRDTAPDLVYGTAREMNSANVTNARFNVTWDFDVDPSFRYFVRVHFCDIVSTALNQLYFNIFINTWSASHEIDLSGLTSSTLAGPYYMDFIAGVSDGSSQLRVSIGPSNSDGVAPDAILNGLEIMKMNDPDGSLGGTGSVSSPSATSPKKNVGVIVGSVVGAFALVVLAAILCLLCRRRKPYQKQQTKTWVPFSLTMGSKFSNGTLSTISGLNLGGAFNYSFAIIQEATNNFDENRVIGVGGFGKVFKGDLRDGTKVAVKRGNPSSQQGIREFRTEIEMLSNFRHRHLVALIGYCDERNEMILVYEFMENGTLKSHLYGSDFPSLSWKQRLQICIESARGLHYLHTSSAKAIIHRDIKSANILLDESLMAKVADFGLSKAGPELDQTHVSTAVKGSFGYLDPEYFRRQQLTEKSDVYSFGVLLLEVLCARPVIDPTLPREMVSLAEWGMKWQRKGQLDQIIDPRLAGQIRSDSLSKFGDTIEKSLAEYGVDRPSIGDVLWNLEYALQLQEAVAENDAEQVGSNRIAAHAAQIEVVTHAERQTAEACERQCVDDLSGVSMSRVFSQLVKSEGR